MFLPECWTPGPTKPQLMLHKMLVGYKMQTHFGQQPLILLPKWRLLKSFKRPSESLQCVGKRQLLPQERLFYLQEQLGAGSAQHKCIISHPPWKLTAVSQTWGRTQYNRTHFPFAIYFLPTLNQFYNGEVLFLYLRE